MINQFLLQLPAETGNTLYGLLGNLQYLAFVGMLLLASVKYRISVKQKIIIWISFAAARLWAGNLIPTLSELTNGIIPKINMGVVFAPFVLIVAAIAYCFHVSVLLSLDVTIPPFILGRGLAITGCIFTGCCHGFPLSWGIYSSEAKTTTFPTVILDIVMSCCIAIYLAVLARKQRYSGNGRVAAMGMILFGLLRILIDILRDNQKLFAMLTAEGLFGIVYLVAGCLLLRYILHPR